MTFNWFRRQFNDSASKQAESAEVQQEKSATEQTESVTSEPAADQAQEEAEDYLNWAKIAYENIRKRQQQPETVQTEVSEEQPAESQVTVPEPESVQTESERDIAVPVTGILVTEVPVTEIPVTEIPTEATPVESELVLETAPAIPESVTAEPESVQTQAQVETDAPGLVETPAIAAETPMPEPEVSEPVVQTPAVEEVVQVDETVLPETESLPEPATSETSSEPVPIEPVLPFWAKAEAERLERLERLRETAIEEPEPEPARSAVATPAPPVIEEIPNLVFDEGFLWSAEVLANQGRRPTEISLEEITWLKRLRQGLDKTRRNLINQLKAIVGQGPLNQDAVDEIESLLLQADVGVEATDHIISSLQKKLRDEVLPPDGAIAYLKEILREMLDKPLGERESNRIPVLVPEKDCLNVWLITGVNGAGKTTTIGKIAHIAQKSGYRCLIAAADTFRAAAVEQVKIWGQRSGVEVIANPGQNTDPAAVVFDAITAAQSRNIELLLVDTAGRLQNKKNLMDELNKIRRIIDKKAGNARIESLLVLDATLGQNGMRQAEVFLDAAQLTGVVLTKLDGTAKGGIALAIVQELDLPIRFIGAGEGIEDLRPFSSYEFIEALLSS